MNQGGKTKRLTCPNCKAGILWIDDNEMVLKNRIVIFRDHGAIAKCKQCGYEVSIPVKFIG